MREARPRGPACLPTSEIVCGSTHFQFAYRDPAVDRDLIERFCVVFGGHILRERTRERRFIFTFCRNFSEMKSVRRECQSPLLLVEALLSACSNSERACATSMRA